MNRNLGSASVLTLAALFLSSGVTAQVHGSTEAALRRNVRPEVHPANDRGRVADSLNMQHMLLLLKRSPDREAALESFIKEIETEGSRNFHSWLTAEEFGVRYGLTSSDLDTVTAWLRSQGFQ